MILANPEEVAAAKEVVKKLTIDYDPEQVANPRLERHYAELEALALERTEVKEVPDQTRKSVLCAILCVPADVAA